MYPRLRFLASHVSSANPAKSLLSKNSRRCRPAEPIQTPTSHERIPGEEGRLDGQNIVARGILRGIGALKYDLQVRRVRVSMVRHAESFGLILETVQRKIGIGESVSIRKIDECDRVRCR
jgi:hypothetical protein